jgi:predicted nuclease of restriction endonuclease-like (RecB) superfamily
MSFEQNTASMAPNGYTDFLIEVKTQIRQRQLLALRAVNSELLALYWWLGENISQRQNTLGWGKAVVENLARDLQAEFPGRNGFSAPNLWFMRQFYNEYRDKPKLQPLVREISWSKNLLIMARCKDDLEREFYLLATARFGWSKSVTAPIQGSVPIGSL